MPQPLVGMELTEIREALRPEQPAYRAKHVYNALYRSQTPDLMRITTLPRNLRQALAARHTPGLPAIDRVYDSADGTRRYLLSKCPGSQRQAPGTTRQNRRPHVR